MSKKYYVYSTLSSGQKYTNYVNGGGDLQLESGSVTIKGGAGIADKRLLTISGAVTEIDEAQLDILNQNNVFLKHKENGFIIVKDKNVSVEKTTAQMESGDGSAPLVDADFDDKNSPATSKKKK